MRSRLVTWLPIALLLAFPLGAIQAEPETREFGSVWIWSDPSSFEEAVAIEVGRVDQGAVPEIQVYLESPKSNRAELTFTYNPEIGGYRLVFRDSISGWRADLEAGFVFEQESILPISQARWSELLPLFNDPEIEGIAFARISLSNGIEVTAEHATRVNLPPDQDEVALLRHSLAAWIAGLSPDELRQDWDFPESTLEMLEFLEIPQVEPVGKRVALLDALVSTSLYAHTELQSRRVALLDEPSRLDAPVLGFEYRKRDWKLTEGSLSSEAADKAGAGTTVDLIKKELAAYE